jgi:hypothetical protein
LNANNPIAPYTPNDIDVLTDLRVDNAGLFLLSKPYVATHLEVYKFIIYWALASKFSKQTAEELLEPQDSEEMDVAGT